MYSTQIDRHQQIHKNIYAKTTQIVTNKEGHKLVIKFWLF